MCDCARACVRACVCVRGWGCVWGCVFVCLFVCLFVFVFCVCVRVLCVCVRACDRGKVNLPSSFKMLNDRPPPHPLRKYQMTKTVRQQVGFKRKKEREIHEGRPSPQWKQAVKLNPILVQVKYSTGTIWNCY